MQPITIKLSYSQAKLLEISISKAFEGVDELDFVKDNDLEGLLILATLRPLYVKLVKITALKFPKPKSIKLEPQESIAIHRMFDYFLDVSGTGIETDVNTLCTQLHQFAINTGRYLNLPGKQALSTYLPSHNPTLIGG